MSILHNWLHYFFVGYRVCVNSLSYSSREIIENTYTNGFFFKHALRSPLTTIVLNLEVSLSTKKRTHTYTQRALAASHYLIQLLNPLTHRRFNTLAKIKQVVHFHNNPHNSNYVYLISKLAQPLKLNGDAVLFQEALSCLIINGLEAYHSQAHKIVIVSIWQENNLMCLTVTDFGRGMTWLTKKFSTTKGFSVKNRNSGYGLWFVEKIVEHTFGGKIMIGSQSLVGTSIRIEIPLIQS